MRRHVNVVLVAFSIGIVLLSCSFAQSAQTEGRRKVVGKMAAVYPDLARKMRISGTVRVEVVVAPDGSPKSPKVLGGHPLLVQAAADAISKWKWVPSPQETTELIELKFSPN